MTHILDNPIWHALGSGNKHMASGSDHVKYISRDVGIFAGLKTNSTSELMELHTLAPNISPIILFTSGEITVPPGWHIALKKDLLQMIHQGTSVPLAANNGIIPLQDEHIPAMQELTDLTKPGPFFSRTIDFGNYEGIFNGDTLVAMTGQRLQPGPYVEVSAVCTHPAHTGKGYAAKLVSSQINKILAASRIPFLHVYPENTAACKLYEKLGFQARKQMLVYRLEKES